MILNDVYKRLHDDGTIEYFTLPFNPVLDYFKDVDYYYLEVFYCTRKSKDEVYNPSYNLEDYIPTDTLNGIINDNSSHLMVLTIEHHTFIIDDIYRFIKKFNIPESKVIWICEIPDSGDKVRSIANSYELQKIPHYYIAMDEYRTHAQLYKYKEYYKQLITLEKKEYKTSYLNFNRRWRTHRLLFVSLLTCHNLIEKGLVSLGDTKEHSTDKLAFYQSLINDKLIDDSTKTILNHNKDKILSLPNLCIGDVDLSNNEMCVSLHATEQNHRPYKDTYFSVVSETLYFEDIHMRFTKEVGRFITEKTFKPIAHKHPFIIIAPHKTLDLMRNLGYKTFSPFIDESYDEIENDMERIKAVLNEVKRLDSLSRSELDNFIDNITPIINYNFNVLLNKRLGEFVTKIG